MRERIIQKTLSQHQQTIIAKEMQAQKKCEQAFSIEEVAIAHKAYTTSCFDDIMNGVENSKNTQNTFLTYQNALKKHGFCESDFEYKPSCSICQDSGNDNGKVCKCVWDKYIETLCEECEIETRARYTFDACNFDIIKDERQKTDLQYLYNLMKKYVDKYPNVKNNTLVFSGGVGTGKTFLTSAICRAIVEKGYCVKFLSAYEFVSLMLKVHTSPISERNELLHDVLSADVLCIDDLGTETMLKNVTVEYLLLVLEERQNSNKTTIITTNLNSGNILARYGERIYSRLHHKQYARVFSLSGNDLRLSQ